ncbi:MAG: hypothetical protein QW688_08530 [Thermoprotei archaeon]
MVEEQHAESMNPVTGSLKFYFSSLYNTLAALVFFLVVAHYQAPTFVGRVAVIQLLQVLSGQTLMFLPPAIYAREISATLARGGDDRALAGSVLGSVLAVSPALLLLLFFPRYMWLSIPFLILNVYLGALQSVASARGRFTQSAVTLIISSSARWFASAVPAYFGSITLLILVWTLGAAASVVYLHLSVGGVRPTFNWGIVWPMFLEGLPLYVSGILSFVSSQGDRVLTALLLGGRGLGVYQLSALMAGAPMVLAGVFTSVLLPSASYYRERGERVEKMCALTLRFSLFVFGVASTLSVFVGVSVMHVFFPAYSEGVAAFKILVLSTLVGASYTNLYSFFVVKRVGLRPLIYISAATAALITLSSYVLIPRVGVTGAAVSQALVQGVSAVVFTVWATRVGVLNIGVREASLIVLYTVVPAAVYVQPLLFPLSLLPLLRFSVVMNGGEFNAVKGFIPARLSFVGRLIGRIVGGLV